MYRIYPCLLWAILCFYSPRLSAQIVDSRPGQSPDYVLIISSYDITNEWAFHLERNFSSYLQGPQKTKILTEYLDMSPQTSLEVLQEKAAEIKKRHTLHNKFILLLGEDAWIFYRTFLGESWSQQPALAVFSGKYTTSLETYLSGKPITESEIISLEDSRKGLNATILYDPIHVRETFRLMNRLIPGLDSVALITDKRRVSTMVLQEVTHFLQDKHPSLHFVNLRMGTVSTEQLIDTIQQLGQHTGIIFHSWYVPDADPSLRNYTNNMKLIIGGLTYSPIFTLYDAGVEEGVITGGHYSTIGALSHQLNELTALILSGERPADIPVTVASDAHSYLNYRNLSYLNIPTRLYPRDAIYYEKPIGNFEKNQTLIICTVVIALLLTVIFFLLVQYKQRQLRDSLRMKEFLVRSNKLQTAFIDNMSHEIRTPLNAIVGFSTLLSESEMLTPEERKNSLQLLSENKDKLLQLINDIMDLSKIESGILEVNPETISLKSTLGDVVNVLQKRYADTGVRVSLAPDTPEQFILCDWRLLAQVLNNLSGILLTYTPQGEIEIGCRIQADEVYLYLTSIGGTIPEEKIHDTFNSFEKGIFNVQEVGVGLILSQAIVKMLKGKIGFMSKSEKTFTFWFTLPLLQQPGKE